MGKFTNNVTEHLVIPARIGLTADERSVYKLLGRSLPQPVSVRLIIDTGSRRTCLTPAIIDGPQPISQGRLRVDTSLASGETTICWLRFEFPETTLKPITELSVARLGLPPALSDFDGVIGRDVLRRWERFVYEGRRGRLTIRDSWTRLSSWFGKH